MSRVLPSLCLRALFVLSHAGLACCAYAVENSVWSFQKSESQLTISWKTQAVCRYVFADPLIPRPYFTEVKTTEGIQVTRRHPPVPGEDAIDHPTMHPGIWLSFGILNENDFWRLKAKTEHLRFEVEPAATGSVARFTVRNRYLNSEETSSIAEELCYCQFIAHENGYTLEQTSTFFPQGGNLVFGDQEEMGLGMRLATPLAVNKNLGGRILDNEGRRNGAQIWGNTVSWCDYAGPLNGQWVGMTLMNDPTYHGPAYSHARDYGFVALNPFGKKVFKKSDSPQQTTVPLNQSLTLRFGIVVHQHPQEEPRELNQRYEEFLARGARRISPQAR